MTFCLPPDSAQTAGCPSRRLWSHRGPSVCPRVWSVCSERPAWLSWNVVKLLKRERVVVSHLWGMNLAASNPNIGRPIWVSDSLIDFFLRKTFSPAADTTLNSILPEKVAVRDLKWKVWITRRECQYWNDLETSSRSMETCSSSSQSFPLGYKHSCHSRSMPWADTKNLSDSMYSPETREKEHWLFDNREPSHH